MGSDPIIIVMLSAALLLPGCSKPRNFKNQNDDLRAQRMTLKQEIGTLQEQLALREEEIRAMREQIDMGAKPIEGVDPPRLAGVVLGVYSGPIDLDGDAKYDALRVYLRPVDQHSRQITAAGTARLRLIVVPAEGEAKTLLDQRYDADTFHKAYRDGVTGTHYTLKADLPADLPTAATLYVSLTDAVSGKVFKTQKEVELVRTKS